MPNWCQNKLIVRGSKENLGRFMEESNQVPEYYYECGWEDDERRDAPYFSFSGLYPIPEELLREQNKQEMIYANAVAEWKVAGGNDNEGNSHSNANTPLSEFLPAEFNKAAMEGWYHWRINHWGTKWDIDHSAQVLDERDLSIPRIEILFDTAWTPPVGWMMEASRQFPMLVFTLRYEELGEMFAGLTEMREGRIVRSECRDIQAGDISL